MVGNQHSPYAGSGTDSNFANSPAINVQAAHTAREAGATHQRTYQACIPCRQRKVRCDLGSVDNPHEPPCLRCRRESKDCYFSSTRRKKRADNNGDGDHEEEDVYVVKAGRKRVRVDPAHVAEEPVERPRTPGGSVGRAQPLRRPTHAKSQLFGEDDIKASEQTTAILQGAEVHGGHDALKVLMEAAGIRGRTASATNNSARPSFSTTLAALPAATSPISHHVPGTGHAAHTLEPPVWKLRPDQTTAVKPSFIDQIPIGAPGYKSAIKAWSRFKFVRNGWFTAKEGMAYVIYFYTYLSPLTPVTLPNLNDFQIHERLLTHESVLAVTILLIASRHMPLEGAGATSRPFTIHNKLWRYLQGMIDRVTWGQEQFGGGFFCAGSQPGCDVNPLTRKGLRTLGTVESLMLLTEWHPRAMHFPPDEADDELMAPDSPIATPDTDSMDDSGKGIGGQRMDSWLEPCWRSDRMCWMLLGMAMSLAFEIGVFDKSEWQRHAYSPTGQPMSAEEMQEYDTRRGNIRDLLLIYVTMTSGRLGLTSMLPNSYSKPEDSELFKSQLGEHTSIQQTVLHFWLRIAAIMREGNRKIFANKNYTRDLIKTGNYKDVLEQCRRPLTQWRREFDDCQVIPTYMRYILAIEYEYTRVYLNSLSLQALAERCANEKPQPGSAPADPRSTITTNGIRTDVAIAPQALHKWLGGDRVYMNEVRDAACSLLKIVVNGLYPGEYLRHAPVRSYFRIISVAIMLLKSFSLGASEADVSDSLKLMDQTVVALRNCIVDDVHVASRFADLLDVLVQNLKPRLVRMSGDGRNARSRKQSVRTTPTSGADVPSNGTASVAGQRSYYTGANNNVWTPYSAMSANPLAGVSDDSYDMSGSHEYSIMPPPTFGMLASPDSTGSASLPAAGVGGYASTYDNGFGGTAQYANGFGTGTDDAQDWFALPLDPILGLAGADVNQTMYGPELGGQDMLELLLNGSNYQ